MAHGFGSDPHDAHAHPHPHGLGAYRWSTLANLALVLVEAGIGLAIGSMALIADAGHNLADVLGLALAWAAARIALRPPDARHTYGYARSTILAALVNGALLLGACVVLAWESAVRLRAPAPVPGLWVMAVAGLGLVVNAGSALLFLRGREHDLNRRGAFLHLVADAAVSLGVVIAGALVWLTGWSWLDPLAGLLVSAVILWSAVGLIREALAAALDAAPRGIDVAALAEELRALSGVRQVHDLHVWPLSTTVAALTAHLVHDGRRDPDALLAEARAWIVARHGIAHSTLQLEREGCGDSC